MHYAARQTPGRGSWTVYDTTTGWPAVLAGRVLFGLASGEAEQLVEALNQRRLVILRQPSAPDVDEDDLCFGDP